MSKDPGFFHQRQDSLHDQLKTVHKLAVDAGCYDAADFLRRQIEDTERRLAEAEIAPVSLCAGCNCMTKTLSCNQCGKCGAWKEY